MANQIKSNNSNTKSNQIESNRIESNELNQNQIELNLIKRMKKKILMIKPTAMSKPKTIKNPNLY